MYFGKLTTLLQALDKPTLKKLDSYIQSPYFKVPVSAVLLFNYLKKQHPRFEEKKIDPVVITRIIPQLSSANKQAKASTELFKAIEHFLALEQLELKNEWQPIYLLQNYKRLGLDSFFENAISKTLVTINKRNEKDIDYFFDIHQLTEVKYNGFHAKLQRNPGNDLTPVTETFDTYHAIKKLRYHCELLNRHQVLGTTYNPGNINEQLQLLRPYTNPQYQYVYLFVHVYKMMAAGGFDEGEEHYNILSSFISENNYKILPQGVIECITYLINYLLFWNNQGNSKAGSQALYWYEVLLKYKLLPDKEKVLPSDYRNIVSLAIINKRDPQWLKNFIDKNEMYLPIEHRATNVAYARAQYFTHVGQYDKAMPLYQQALAKDEPVFNMIVRSSQFRCMYESNMQNKEVLLDFLASWKRQLHRNTHGLHQLKKWFLKIIGYNHKLILATDKNQRNKVLLALSSESFFPGKQWLETQLKK